MRGIARQLWVLVLVVVGLVAFGLTTDFGPVKAAGTNQYSPPEWYPLRAAARVNCVLDNCSGPHHGYWAIDLLDPTNTPGDPIYAAGAGKVHIISASDQCGGSGTPGNYLSVDHSGGVLTYYFHLQSFAVAEGAWVDQNTVLGYMGSTGSTSPCPTHHLHFEKRVNGTKVDPGELKACHGSTLVTYPAAFNVTGGWNGAKGKTATSDGTSCGSSNTSRRKTSDVDADGRDDFCFTNDQATTGSGKLELHCLSASSNFQTFNMHAASPFAYLNRGVATAHVADVDGDGKTDLCVATDQGPTTSGKVELDCASGASNYATRVAQGATALPLLARDRAYTALGDVDGDGRADLCVIADQSTTTSGKVELTCAGAANSFGVVVLQKATSAAFPNRAASLTTLAYVDGDARADLCTIADQAPTTSGNTEIRCLSAASNYATTVLDVATSFGFQGRHGSVWSWADVDGDHRDDLCVTLDQPTTGSGKTELHCLKASSNYTTMAAQVAVAQPYLNRAMQTVVTGHRSAATAITAPPPVAKSITVTSPNGGETWRRTDPWVIKWRHSGVDGTTVRVEVVDGNGRVFVVKAAAKVGLRGVGQAQWTPPTGLRAGRGFYARVTVNASSPSVTDRSDTTFTVV